MKPVLLLIHGWGFDAGFWAPLQAMLEPGAAVAWDLGFFGQTAQPPLPAGRPVVAVGHSFGLLWLLRHRPVTWRGMVSINGFARFARCETFPDGMAAKLLERMMSQFGKTPMQVVADFHARCGSAAAPPAALNHANLLAGLQALARWDERPALVQLALCGRNDPLVSEAMSRVCFPEDRIIWHDGGHLLPQEDPAWCVARLRELTESPA